MQCKFVFCPTVILIMIYIYDGGKDFLGRNPQTWCIIRVCYKDGEWIVEGWKGDVQVW